MTDGNLVVADGRRPPGRPPARPRRARATAAGRTPSSRTWPRATRSRSRRRGRATATCWAARTRRSSASSRCSRSSPARRRRACHIPYARRVGARARAVAVGGAHRPPAAAHPRRGRACSASTGPTTARKAERELGYEWRPLARRPARHAATGCARRPAGDGGVSLSRGELARQARPRRVRGLRAAAALPELAAGGAHGARRVRLQLAGAAAARRPRACGAQADVARGYPLGILALSARRARRSSSSSATRCGWRRRSGASSPWATAWPSLVGQAAGGPRLPWNPRKGWAGFVAFVVFGAVGRGVPRRPGPRGCRSPRTPRTGRARSASRSRSPSSARSSSRCPRRSTTTSRVPLAAALALPLLAGGRPGLLLAIPALRAALARSASRVNARDRARRLAGALDRRARAPSPRS